MPHVGLGETAWAAQTPAPTEHHKMISFTFKALAYLHTYLEKRVRLLAFFFLKETLNQNIFALKSCVYVQLFLPISSSFLISTPEMNKV